MTETSAASRLQKLLRMLEAEPGDAFCLYAIAQEHLRLGAPEEALAWFDRTIAADPAHAYAHFHAAKMLEQLGRIGDARRMLDAGRATATRSGDAKAASEIAGYLDTLPATPRS
jgi:predicted Zn-dependent protease